MAVEHSQNKKHPVNKKLNVEEEKVDRLLAEISETGNKSKSGASAT